MFHSLISDFIFLLETDKIGFLERGSSPVPGRDLCIQVSGLFFCKMSNIAEKRSWKELYLVDDGQKGCVKLKSFFLAKKS